MKIINVGCGKLGTAFIESLLNEGHDVTAIDIDPHVIEEIVYSLDVLGITGTGSSCRILSEADVENADILVATTESDEMNLLTGILAKKMGAKHAVARVREPEYSRQLNFMRRELGMGLCINPELEAAMEIARILTFPAAIKIDSFNKGRVNLAEIALEKGSPLIGQKVMNLNKKFKTNILVCAVRRDGKAVIPSGGFVLMEDDHIHITASHKELIAFFKAIGIYRQRLKNAMIVGGGKITHYLAETLIDAHIKVTIIEKEFEICRELKRSLPEAEIINGDGTDQKLLLEEGMPSRDAVVALTGIDEENIIMSLYAKRHNIKKIILKVNNPEFMKLVVDTDDYSIITPKVIATNHILRYVRTKQNIGGSGVRTLYKLVDGLVEALEFEVTGSAPKSLLNTALKSLELKPNLLIASIVRGNKIINPHGEDFIQAGDFVIVVTTNQMLDDIGDILLNK